MTAKGGDNTNERETRMLSMTLALVTGLLLGPFALASAADAEENIFVQGSPVHGANGLFFDAQDRLHIASLWGYEIVIMDPDSGDVLDRFDIKDGVYCPDDVTIGPDGSIYWTAMLAGHVGRMAPDGTVTRQNVAPGVNPITVNDEGRVFVGLDFLGDGLYELDPELQDPPKLLHGSLGGINAFDFGPDGYLYGPTRKYGRQLLRIDVNTDPATIEVVLEDGAGGVKFDSKGRLHFHGADGITRLDLDTMEMEVLHPRITGLDNMAFDSQDRLFVSNSDNGMILQILPADEKRVVAQGGMILPNGVCAMTIEGQERILVGDVWTIREFDPTTGEMLRVISDIPADHSPPSALTLHPDGDNLIISTWMGDYIYIFDPETEQVLDFFEEESWGVVDAIRFMGDVIFTDNEEGKIKRVDDTTIAEGFSYPSGLVTIGNDLYAADRDTGIVWQVFDDGILVKRKVAKGLSKPEGLTDDVDGNLLVVETGSGRLSRIDVRTGQVTLVADGLSIGFAAMPMFSGVDVDSAGSIYVTGDLANVLYRFELAQRPEQVWETDFISGYIEGLNRNTFSCPDRASRTKGRMCRMLDQLEHMIDGENYYAARAILRCLRRRTDGSGDDLVIHPGARRDLLAMIDELMSRIEEHIN